MINYLVYFEVSFAPDNYKDIVSFSFKDDSW
jgi:hypothetical protein